MKTSGNIVVRVTGIVLFMLVLSAFLETIGRSVESFAFFISSSQLGWGLYYIFTSVLFSTFFFFALFSHIENEKTEFSEEFEGEFSGLSEKEINKIGINLG